MTVPAICHIRMRGTGIGTGNGNVWTGMSRPITSINTSAGTCRAHTAERKEKKNETLES